MCEKIFCKVNFYTFQGPEPLDLKVRYPLILFQKLEKALNKC